MGSFVIRVTASDGIAAATTTFGVTVTNSAPVFTEPLPDVTMSHSEDTRTVDLNVMDADGDAITFTATAYQTNLVAERAFQFTNGKSLRESWRGFGYNHRGRQEKYFEDVNTGIWYAILPNGELHRWPCAFDSKSLVTTLSGDYWADPYRIFRATQPAKTQLNASQVQLSVEDGRLTIDPADGYVGSFVVSVSASDGLAKTTASFQVTRVASLTSGTTGERAAGAIDQLLGSDELWYGKAAALAEDLVQTLADRQTLDQRGSTNRNTLAQASLLLEQSFSA